MTARADAIPQDDGEGGQPTRVLNWYALRETFHYSAERCADEDYDTYSKILNEQYDHICSLHPTCMADLAAQVLTATEHGERGLNADMVERLRKLVTEAGQ